MSPLPGAGHSELAAPKLRVRQLAVGFDGGAPVVDGVSFELPRGAVLGLIGESGSGKTLVALSLTRLLPPRAHIRGGQILLDGEDLSRASEARMDALRRHEMALIFQEPMLALSPLDRIGAQLAARLRLSDSRHRRDSNASSRRSLHERSVELLREVELPEPKRLLDAHPHQLSAGMRRRAALAMALAGEPELLIADELTTGLDTPIQAQVLDLLARLVRERAMSVLFISHDLGAVAEIASHVLVMQAGKIVEDGMTASVFGSPRHPYTRSLLGSVPSRLEVFAPPRRASERVPRRSPSPAAELDAALGDE